MLIKLIDYSFLDMFQINYTFLDMFHLNEIQYLLHNGTLEIEQTLYSS